MATRFDVEEISLTAAALTQFDLMRIYVDAAIPEVHPRFDVEQLNVTVSASQQAFAWFDGTTVQMVQLFYYDGTQTVAL